MKLADFASLVQLGVGLHAGTAVLQLANELGLGPTERRLERAERFCQYRHSRAKNTEQKKAVEDAIDNLSGVRNEFERVKQQFFAEYRRLTNLNLATCLSLTGLLIWISFAPDRTIGLLSASALTAISVAPAIVSICYLFLRLRTPLKGIAADIAAAETKALALTARKAALCEDG